jgi:hypothetical protein
MVPVQESRERHRLFAPPRLALNGEGPSVFGPGFWRLLRDSGGGGCFLVFFMGIGLALALFGVAGTVGPWRDAVRGSNDPRFFLAIMGMGSLFVMIPLRILQVELVGQRNATLRKNNPKSRKQPWLLDHPWKPEMKPDYTGEAGGSVLGRIAFLALIGFFNKAWEAPGLFFKVIIVLFDLFALLIVYDSLRQLAQALRHVRASLRWTTLPAFLGRQLQGTLLLQPGLHAHGLIRATLRCVQDEEVPGSQDTGPTIEPFVIYEQTRMIPASDEKLRELPFSFDIPRDLPGTRLQRQEAIYWQVTLEVPLLGPDFETVFLAPVYEP